MIRRTDTIIIGAGQAGLATSRCLTDQGIDHVLLERGAIAERWRSERWNSLHLLTPNWLTRLPRFGYAGDDPDGFMHKDALATHLERYSRSFTAPVIGETEVLSLARDGAGFVVTTSRGRMQARSVVIATGACDTPNRPGFARALAPGITQETPSSYKSPAQIAPGGVLVVGASATGVQLAEELSRAGHPVTLAVGSHVRVPRRYRGRDLMVWLDRCGVLDDPRAPSAEIDALLRHPSLQLVGAEDGRDIDLGSLQRRGIRITGRLTGAAGHVLRFTPSPKDAVDAAEARRLRLLERIDRYIAAEGLAAPDPAPAMPVQLEPGPSELDLRAEGITTVLWATGYRRSYPWLNLPVLTPSGEIQQIGGVAPVPGLFTMGLPFMRHRSSTFLGGVGRDAQAISNLIAEHLGAPRAQVA